MRILRIEHTKIFVAIDSSIDKIKTIVEVQSKLYEMFGISEGLKVTTFIRSINDYGFKLNKNETLYTVICVGVFFSLD